MSDNKSAPPVKNLIESKRLPCRGCTKDCKNYVFCDGKPWRQAQKEAEAGSKIH